MDQIHIKGLRVFAFHGVKPEEKRDGQHFGLDITLYVSVKRPGVSDKLSDTVNYSKAAKTAARVMMEERYDLIERAATRVAEQLLLDFSTVEQVRVCLKKPEAPVKLDFDYMAVEIMRTREDFH